MERMVDASPVTKLVAWLGVVLASGAAAFVVIGATHDEFLDCSNPEIHESANTTLGWAVAVAASVSPLALAIWLAGGLRRRLSAVAIAVALLSLVWWRWLLDAGCEWYAAAWPVGAPLVG